MEPESTKGDESTFDPAERSPLYLANRRGKRHPRLSLPWLKQRCRVDPERGCWEWRGALNRAGYGRVAVGGRVEPVHRVAYRAAHGAIPDDALVLHSCDNPRCCNPEHLSAGDQKENVRQMHERKRGRPPKGEAHGNAKLTAQAVRVIRESGEDERSLARRYRVSVWTVRDVRSGRAWAHVKSSALMAEAAAAAQAKFESAFNAIRARSKEMAAKRRKRGRRP